MQDRRVSARLLVSARRLCVPHIHDDSITLCMTETARRFGHVWRWRGMDRKKTDGRTSRTLRAGPFRTGSRPFSLSLKPRDRERERRRGRPWEARAICIPNDRMTFARCIKMPLIDGARENTFADLVSRCCSIKRSRPPLLLSDHLEDINSLTEGTKRGETEQKEPRPRVKFDQMAPNSILPSIFHSQLI